MPGHLNPFINAAEHNAMQLSKVKAIQAETNRISQPYFQSIVKKEEHPIVGEEIVKELQRGVINKPITEEYVSKLLYNKVINATEAMKLTDDIRKGLFNRKTPALTAENVKELVYPLSSKVKSFVNSMRKSRGGFKQTTTSQTPYFDEIETLLETSDGRKQLRDAIKYSGIGQTGREFIENYFDKLREQ